VHKQSNPKEEIDIPQTENKNQQYKNKATRRTTDKQF